MQHDKPHLPTIELIFAEFNLGVYLLIYNLPNQIPCQIPAIWYEVCVIITISKYSPAMQDHL